MDLNTPAASKVVGGLSLFVVGALSWVLVLGPETSTLADTRLQIESTRQQNTVLAQQLTSLEKQRGQLRATRDTANDLADKFPPTADQPGLFREVTAAAVDAGIGASGVTTLAPTPPVIGGADGTGVAADPPTPASGSPLAHQTVSVSVTGTYDQTQQLLKNLENMPRAYLVTSVTLSGDGTSDAYTTTIAGDMFVMPPVKDPGETINLNATTTD